MRREGQSPAQDLAEHQGSTQGAQSTWAGKRRRPALFSCLLPDRTSSLLCSFLFGLETQVRNPCQGLRGLTHAGDGGRACLVPSEASVTRALQTQEGEKYYCNHSTPHSRVQRNTNAQEIKLGPGKYRSYYLPHLRPQKPEATSHSRSFGHCFCPDCPCRCCPPARGDHLPVSSSAC